MRLCRWSSIFIERLSVDSTISNNIQCVINHWIWMIQNHSSRITRTDIYIIIYIHILCIYIYTIYIVYICFRFARRRPNFNLSLYAYTYICNMHNWFALLWRFQVPTQFRCGKADELGHWAAEPRAACRGSSTATIGGGAMCPLAGVAIIPICIYTYDPYTYDPYIYTYKLYREREREVDTLVYIRY
jgi:hypothetical protein